MVRLVSFTMETGYHTNYFSSDDSWGKELPGALIPGETLDADIEQIANAIRAWVLDKHKGEHHSISVSISGPFDGLMLKEARKTPEEKLAESKDESERFYALGRAAKSRFDAGDFESAREYALELQKMIPNNRDADAVASVNIVLGRLALRDGKVEKAEKYLLEAGKVPGSPVLSSFGPNMSLAHDLLIAGHSAAVLEYFKLCEVFWNPKFSQLEKWTEDVDAGRIPEFGANLVY